MSTVPVPVQSLPTPGEVLGAPYGDWRPGQEVIVRQIINWATNPNAPRFMGLIAPTGTGKSVIATYVARYTERRGIVLTHTIQLQEQYINTIPEMGLLKGRGKFTCNLTKNDMIKATAADMASQCSGCNLRAAGCDYYKARAEALAQPLLTINYAKWIYDRHARNAIWKCSSRCTPWNPCHETDKNILIMDEGDVLEDATRDAASIDMPTKRLKEMSGVNLEEWINNTADVLSYTHGSVTPEMVLSNLPWVEFYEAVAKGTEERIEAIIEELESLPRYYDAGKSEQERIKKLGAAKNTRDLFLKGVQGLLGSEFGFVNDWMMDRSRREIVGVISQPVTPAVEFRKFMDDWRVDKTLIMSATMSVKPEYWENFLGITPNEIQWAHIPGRFPPENSPIYMPVQDGWFLTAPTTTKIRRRDPSVLDTWAATIDKVASDWWVNSPDDNILLYLRSNTNLREWTSRTRIPGEKIMHYSQDEDVFIGNLRDSGVNDRASTIKAFSQSKGKILLGTGIERGLDLADQQCRLLIVAVMPRLAPGLSKLFPACEQLMPGYMNEVTAQDFVQLVGRIVRGPEDWGHVVIVDSDAPNWMRVRRDMLPIEVKNRVFQSQRQVLQVEV